MLDEPLLRKIFEEAVDQSGAFGAQLSIIKGDEQLDFVAGLAHAKRGLAMTADTLMQIGSITKLCNAIIVISLAQDGALDLNAPVKEYLPTFEVLDPQATRSLTLQHLLSMSSGLDNGPYVYFGPAEDALGLYVDQLKSLPQHFPPGHYFGYSNAGTCIAGYVASRVTGKPWEALLRERILQPASLNQSAVLEEDLQDKRISVGHYPSQNGGKPTIVEPMLAMARARAPSGSSLALSASHLARLGKIFTQKGKADTGARILSESSVERMTSPRIETLSHKYGTAWCIGPCMGDWNGVRVFGHGGTTSTSSAFLYWIPNQKGVIAFIVNTIAAMGEFSRIAFDEILTAAFGFSKPPIDVPSIPVAPVDPRRYVGTYEALGMRLQVTEGEGETLSARFVTQRTAQELAAHELIMNQPERLAILVPLGGDRFLVHPHDSPDKHRGVVDTAFFGTDRDGRATHALNLVFPMSRVEI